ncbi:hypothetical protein KY495_04075 [Massilia sp. PAMC28688]|uniref:hypothetical protein n=1 Tax=Massilia sp. PAMC28688 TaxID=2861283 RepID=UPI001C63687A|nr:hypothetical protein [Massilia sp. PAMC28688]QYF94404.1 hypothetical protein KY495_04075 [Massilia sp. PAMC28688]
MKANFLYPIAAVMLATGCAAAPPKEIPMNATIKLQPTRTAEIGDNARLRFDGVEDSRCPPDVQCITAGMITYKFTLTADNGTESFALNKDKPSYDATTVAARVALGPLVEPAPRATTASTPPPVHTVTLKITRR